jgi:hypothetical protein
MQLVRSPFQRIVANLEIAAMLEGRFSDRTSPWRDNLKNRDRGVLRATEGRICDGTQKGSGRYESKADQSKVFTADKLSPSRSRRFRRANVLTQVCERRAEGCRSLGRADAVVRSP